METVEKTKKNRTYTPRARQLKLAAEVVKNTKRKKPLSQAQLLELAGYGKGTVDKTPFKAFTSQGFQVALRNMGATEEKMARVVNEAMDAKGQAWFKGEHLESEHADHAIRLRAVEQLAELTGAKITKVQVQSVNLTLGAEDMAKMFGL